MKKTYRVPVYVEIHDALYIDANSADEASDLATQLMDISYGHASHVEVFEPTVASSVKKAVKMPKEAQ